MAEDPAAEKTIFEASADAAAEGEQDKLEAGSSSVAEENADDGGDEGGEGGEGGAAKKKKRKKKKKPKKSGAVKDAEYYQRALADVPSEIIGDPMAMDESFKNFAFTGPLRPAQVTTQREVPDDAGIPKPDYSEDGYPTSEMVGRKPGASKSSMDIHDAESIEGMRYAGKMGREVIDIAGKFLKVGVTGDEIDRVVHYASLERNGYPSPLNYHNFPKSVCVSPNEVICHGIPDCRPIEDGDVVNLDVTIYVEYKGKTYHADLNETYLVGNVSDEDVHLVRVAYECLQTAQKMLRPGTLYRELGNHITKVANSQGCSVVKTYCGHGIGNLFHTTPNVPHYSKNKAVGIMRPGHSFTVEPMINQGSWKDKTWPDDWTAVTADGKRSAQFEHTFMITETGVEIMTARPGTDRTKMPDWDRTTNQR
jgi:methionyl aminopeptidase